MNVPAKIDITDELSGKVSLNGVTTQLGLLEFDLFRTLIEKETEFEERFNINAEYIVDFPTLYKTVCELHKIRIPSATVRVALKKLARSVEANGIHLYRQDDLYRLNILTMPNGSTRENNVLTACMQPRRTDLIRLGTLRAFAFEQESHLQAVNYDNIVTHRGARAETLAEGVISCLNSGKDILVPVISGNDEYLCLSEPELLRMYSGRTEVPCQVFQVPELVALSAIRENSR